MNTKTNSAAPAVGQQPLVLPVLRDQNGQQIRENDILRVFHFYGRRRGKGREKHYMYKVARLVHWPRHNDTPLRTWAFFHTAAPPEGGLKNCYSPYQNGKFHTDQTLDGVEVLYSPETLRIENEKRRIPRQNVEVLSHLPGGEASTVG